jgi:hypothetical protein
MGGFILDHMDIFIPPHGGNMHGLKNFLITQLNKGQVIIIQSGISILDHGLLGFFGEECFDTPR